MILKLGKNNSAQAVRALQYLLGTNVTGTYDSKTKAAVKALQKAWDLKQDGIAGPDTLSALCKTLPGVKYKDYSQNRYVYAVQSLLGASIDGKYGKSSRANAIAFQTAAGLKPTGDILLNDWLALWDCAYEKTAPGAGDTGGVQAPLKSTPLDFKQYDKRWKSIMYSAKKNKKQTIGSSGCGPTSMTDIMAAWVDGGITPVKMCEYALKRGFRTANSGTAWGYFKSVAQTYAPYFGGFTQTRSMATLKKALESGAFAVASMGPGYWTKGGHFICVYRMDGKYVYARDPASATRKKQKISDFEKQRKQFFIFYKR